MDKHSRSLMLKDKSASVSQNVVFEPLEFSKDEQNQFEEYNPTSNNPLFPLFSILQSTCPAWNNQGDVLPVSKTRGFGRFHLVIQCLFGKVTKQLLVTAMVISWDHCTLFLSVGQGWPWFRALTGALFATLYFISTSQAVCPICAFFCYTWYLCRAWDVSIVPSLCIFPIYLVPVWV